MSSCEKCWGNSYDPYTGHERYGVMVLTHTCSAEEQAGPDASRCPHCRLLTIHQHTKQPMCGCYQASDSSDAAK